MTERVRDALGQQDLGLELATSGASRAGYVVTDAGGEPRAFLRLDDGTSGLSGTTYDLAREGRTLRVVRGHGIPVPGVLGVFDDPPALVLEYIAGTNAPPDEHRDAVARQYMHALARIHRLPQHALDRPVPTTAGEAISQDLEWWGRYAGRTGVDERPLVGAALGKLRALRPELDSPPRFVHGDAGPGNLLADGPTLVAVLDWEMAHLGDGHEDLAWVWLRAVHTPFGDLATRMDDYAAASGEVVDRERLRWHLVFVLTKTVIALAVSLERGGQGRLASLHRTLWTVYAALLAATLRDLDPGGSDLEELAAIATALKRDVTADRRARTMIDRARNLDAFDSQAAEG